MKKKSLKYLGYKELKLYLMLAIIHHNATVNETRVNGKKHLHVIPDDNTDNWQDSLPLLEILEILNIDFFPRVFGKRLRLETKDGWEAAKSKYTSLRIYFNDFISRGGWEGDFDKKPEVAWLLPRRRGDEKGLRAAVTMVDYKILSARGTKIGMGALYKSNQRLEGALLVAPDGIKNQIKKELAFRWAEFENIDRMSIPADRIDFKGIAKDEKRYGYKTKYNETIKPKKKLLEYNRNLSKFSKEKRKKKKLNQLNRKRSKGINYETQRT